ncbi:BC85_0335 family putative methyltransferase [Mycoplasma marinum]|uniref:Uncharacterized protein n=1 Tax=Mycoplasma marinum TaxID=1937190 RepID=A0A4V2NI71_9MOLU|nr:hypothetical protein [Mycoplasma marinum]TCG11711.1 hypothetical protein C4B24_00985 [Mycoplasma marinum]
MSNTTRYILIASVFIVLAIGFTVFLVLFLKARKLKKIILKDAIKLDALDEKNKAVFERKDIGEMIWELKDKINNPLDDISMEYFITTIIRNGFKTVWIENETEGYEIITLALKTKTKISTLKSSIIDLNKFKELLAEFNVPEDRVELIEKKNLKDKFDFVILSNRTKEYNTSFDNTWVNVDKNGMLIITDCRKLTRDQKDLIRYLKLIGIRFEHQKIHEGFIIAAK